MNKVVHPFTSPKSDGADPTLVQPSNWNAGHRAGVELTNRTGGGLVSGDVVGLSAANDESVVLADTPDTTRQLVVAMETIADTAAGLFAAVGAWTVKVASAVVRGNYLAKSGTSKALYDTGLSAASNPPPSGAVAVALTGAGGAGTVVGLLLTSGSGGGFSKGADIASATTLPIPSSGTFFHVTGTAAITAMATRQPGQLIVLEFEAALQITHNATTLILQKGRNYITEAGDTLFFVAEGAGNWRQVSPFHAALTFLELGANPAASGALRLPNAAAIMGRNAANTADVAVAQVDNQNRVVVGPGGSSNIVVSGQLRADIESTARVVLPVGSNKWAT